MLRRFSMVDVQSDCTQIVYAIASTLKFEIIELVYSG